MLFSYSVAFPIPRVESACATITGTVIPGIVMHRFHYDCSIVKLSFEVAKAITLLPFSQSVAFPSKFLQHLEADVT